MTPAQRFTTIHHYVTVERRLILRNIGEVVGRNGDFEVVERAMLNSVERFWLCIACWQHLQTKKDGEGVPGARRGTRIRDIAADLQVPGDLASLYRHAQGGDFLWYPPATMDLPIAEREDGHRYPDFWPWVLENESALVRKDENLEIVYVGSIDSDDVEREQIKKQKNRFERCNRIKSFRLG